MPSNTGVVNTPQGQFTWALESDGSVQASGNGQQLNASDSDSADDSSTRVTQYSLAGQPPYLTINFVIDNGKRSVQTTVKNSSSELTLAITNIAANNSSGTGTVSGTFGGSPVNWTGPVDLTSKPVTGGGVAGWPKDAFATEIQQAAVFIPVVLRVAAPSAVGIPVATGSGGRGKVHAFSVGQVVGNAGVGCAAGALWTSFTGPGGAFLGCVGGVGASLVWDFFTSLTDPGPGGGVDPAMQNLLNTMQQVANTPLPTPQGSSGAPQSGGGNGGDDDGGGGDDTGGGGSGEGPDDKPGLQPK